MLTSKFFTALVFAAVVVAVFVVASIGAAVGANATGTVHRYDNVNGNGPTVVIRGAFATAEDMTTLRLVDYDPANDRVVYRVVNP